MTKNSPTRAARKLRKKRRAKALLCSQIVAAYRSGLAAVPKARLALCRAKAAARSAKIIARRKNKTPAAPFLIGGASA